MANEPIDSTKHPAELPFPKMIGQWIGNTKVWFEPGDPVDNSPCEASFKGIFNGKALQWDYTGAMQGKPLVGTALIAFNKQKGEFQMSWMDSFHTGSALFHCLGQAIDSGFSVLTHYSDPSGGPDWGWRTDFRLSGNDKLTISMYNIFPDNTEQLGVETVLTRKK